MSADNPPPLSADKGGCRRGLSAEKGGYLDRQPPFSGGCRSTGMLHRMPHCAWGGGGFGWHVKWKNRMCFPPCPLPPRPRSNGLQLRRHPGQPSCWLGRGGCVPRWDGAGGRRGGAPGGDVVQHLPAWASLTLSGWLVSFFLVPSFAVPFLCRVPVSVSLACCWYLSIMGSMTMSWDCCIGPHSLYHSSLSFPFPLSLWCPSDCCPGFWSRWIQVHFQILFQWSVFISCWVHWQAQSQWWQLHDKVRLGLSVGHGHCPFQM